MTTFEFGWRSSPEMIDEDFRGAVYGSHVEDYRRAPKERLTARYHGYIIVDESDKGQDASWRIEAGNPNEID